MEHPNAPLNDDSNEAESRSSGAAGSAKPCCCCPAIVAPKVIIQTPPSMDRPWVVGTLDTPRGAVPRVSHQLQLADHLGACRIRGGIGRMHYRVDPGLYAVGNPTADSPVLVSANYKLSFDRLRSQLAGVDAWVLVLDTKGVNVWCAAGKGTFGTDEVVGRVRANHLDEIVSHRTLVLPQLSAPGVAAHQVKNRCGFRVVYGPVRAADLPTFLANEMKATPEMREVRFPLLDRLVLTPVELVRWAKHAVVIAIALLLLAGVGPEGYSWARVAHAGAYWAGLFAAAFVASNLLGPALLPWLPGRALSLKGACLGVAMVLGLIGWHFAAPGGLGQRPEVLGWSLLIPAMASFITMNFVGSTTYTSLSGVRREMWIAVPLQSLAVVAGVGLLIAGRFL